MLAETPVTLRCELPRNPSGDVDVHALSLEVCCDAASEDGLIVIDEWTRAGDDANFEVPELDPGLYYAACLHSAATVGSQPWYEPIPLPEPGGAALLAGALLVAWLGRRR